MNVDDISRFGRYDIFECENCGEQEKCKSMGYMTSSPVDSDRSCCDHPSYEKVAEESAYTVSQFQQLLDERIQEIEDAVDEGTFLRDEADSRQHEINVLKNSLDHGAGDE